jgi:chromosome segregation ATPase
VPSSAKTPDVLEQLYGAEPDDFVAERKRLERLLRDESRAEEAAELAKLRKPPVPVHAANRLAREHADDVAKLIAAGEGLAGAHGRGDADELRGAQRELTDRVTTLVRQADLSDAMEHRLGVLLRAAAIDAESADLLRRGVLAEEVEPTAFEALAGMTIAKPKGRPAAAKREPSAADARKRRKQIEELEGELSEAKSAMRSAERQVAAAEKERDRATKRVDQLTERIEKARQAV